MTLPTPPAETTPHPNRLLLIGALGGAVAVLLLLVALLVGYWLGRTSQPSVTAAAQPSASPVASATPATTNQTFLPSVIVEPTATTETDPALVAPLPADPALAAEEVDRHNDEQQRLTAQKQTLSQQVTDSDQLIKLKAEQIRLLEAELARQP